MTTTDIEQRPFTRFPDYTIGVNKSVWSIDRTRPGKSGSVRRNSAKRLKPDTAKRVWLTVDGIRGRHNVDRLYGLHFPDHISTQPQAWCRRGHPLLPYQHDRMASWVAPRVAYWGHGHRVCLYCTADWIAPPARAVTPAIALWCSPPMLRPGERTIGIRRDRQTVGQVVAPRDDTDDSRGDGNELLAAGHRSLEETFVFGPSPFPHVCPVPDSLQGLDALMGWRS